MRLQSFAKTGNRNVLICDLGTKTERSIKFPVKRIVIIIK